MLKYTLEAFSQIVHSRRRGGARIVLNAARDVETGQPRGDGGAPGVSGFGGDSGRTCQQQAAQDERKNKLRTASKPTQLQLENRLCEF
eukprot:3511608-Pyramimonas_sp.AAC.1